MSNNKTMQTKKHIIKLVGYAILLKVIYLSLTIVLDPQQKSIYQQYLDMASKNDAQWYQSIGENGYPKINSLDDFGYVRGAECKQSAWAFFPFYPELNQFTAKILAIDYRSAAFIWSLIFSVIAMIGFYLFSAQFFKDYSKAYFSTLVMFGFPFSFYFSMFYTEALFFTCLIFSFLAIQQHRNYLLILFLVPLILLRPNGVIMLIPLFLYFLEQNNVLANRKIVIQNISRTVLLQILFFVIASLAFFLYGYYQYKTTGYFFAFSKAQVGWNRKLMFPLLAFFRQGDMVTQFNSIYTILVILFAYYFRNKLTISLNALLLISFLLPLMSGNVNSMTRYISLLFPLFIIAAPYIYKSKHKYAILGLFLVLHFVSFYSWIINHALSY